jgi:hypothetical protein
MTSVIYGGKMSVDFQMNEENLFVVFPEGLADGRTAHVLGTWTEDIDGEKKKRLALINYTCEFITGTNYLIKKEFGPYSLEIGVSGEELHVRLLDKDGDPASDKSTLFKMQ